MIVLPEKDEDEWCEVKDMHSRIQVWKEKSRERILFMFSCLRQYFAIFWFEVNIITFSPF